MRSFYIHFSIVLLLGTIACKQEATTDQEGATQSVPGQNTTGAAQESSKLSDGSAAATGGHDYTFLTDKLFHYKAAFGGTKGGEQPYKDEWIDLDANGSYKAGKLKQQTHTGKWTYNHETKLLFLKPDVNTFPMSEWKVMYNNQMMVWVGTQTYGNNATQIQLARSDVMP